MSELFAGQGTTLVADALNGYRQWISCNDPVHMELRSMGMTSHYWQNAEIDAECRMSLGGTHVEDTVPSETCSSKCGIYGWYHPDNVSWEVSTPPNIPYAIIFGVVKYTGKTLLGTKGFRAAHAKIAALHLNVYDAAEEIAALGAFTITTSRYGNVDFMDTKPAMGVQDRKRIASFLETKYEVPVYLDKEKLLRDFPPEDMTNLLGKLPPAEKSTDEYIMFNGVRIPAWSIQHHIMHKPILTFGARRSGALTFDQIRQIEDRIHQMGERLRMGGQISKKVAERLNVEWVEE